ncbi:hypothetical protein FNU77_00080 (plasmid) [Prescottella equi]|nr:hypothetical protein [Prescottella equi]QDP08227.1 hypothetical protein FNU77_00080 [Prescottella equi]
MTKWAQHNWEAGWMGYPTSDEIPNGDNIGSRQHFETANAAIYWNSARPLEALSVIGGAIRDKWGTVGWETPGSFLGYPTSDEKHLPDGAGRMNTFERGTIYWSPTTGAWTVVPGILDAWSAAGYELGTYGYPVGDQYSLDGDVYVKQNFQHGIITVPGPAARALSSLQRGTTPQGIIDGAIQLANNLGLPLPTVLQQGLVETQEAQDISAGYGDAAPGEEMLLPTPRGAGDIFFSHAATFRADHGHMGIFVTLTHSVEASDESGVTIRDNVVGGGRRDVRNPEMFWINTSASVRQGAVDFALSKVGLDYNYYFWDNKLYPAITPVYNCSSLVWAAYYVTTNGAVDLDYDGGTAVWPLDIVHSPNVTRYPTT